MIETIITKLKEYRGALLLLRDTQLSIECERQGNIELLEIYAHKILDALCKGDDEGLLTDNEITEALNAMLEVPDNELPTAYKVVAKAQQLLTRKQTAEEIENIIIEERKRIQSQKEKLLKITPGDKRGQLILSGKLNTLQNIFGKIRLFQAHFIEGKE